MAAQVALALAIIVPMGPMVYRLAYQPLAEASVLMLLIVSVAVHVVMVGLGLLVFGAEGSRTPAFSDGTVTLGTLTASAQSLWVIGCSLVLIVAFSVLFDRTVYGKALRATAINRLGARLMGIPTEFAGKLSFFLCALIGAVSGILIAPITTIYYDSGFLIGLKGFVAAIIGGLASYPIAAAGRAAGRTDRIVLFVLGQRIQGSDRVHVDHSGAAVALAAHASRRRRRMKSANEAAVRSAWFVAALVLCLLVAPLVLSEFSITLLQLHRACFSWSCSGSCC